MFQKKKKKLKQRSHLNKNKKFAQIIDDFYKKKNSNDHRNETIFYLKNKTYTRIFEFVEVNKLLTAALTD